MSGMDSTFIVIGNIESSIPQILRKRKIIFTDKEQGSKIEALISGAIKKYATPLPDAKALSIDCYCFLMHCQRIFT